MNKPRISLYAIVEGRTEQTFIERILKLHLSKFNINLYATQVSKPGQKGGDVRFDRVKGDIKKFLSQRPDTYITTMVDYYGVKDWPGIMSVPAGAYPEKIAEIVNKATQEAINQDFAKYNAINRFIPYMSIHEFEALLFSDSHILSTHLDIPKNKVDSILKEFSTPEAINNNRNTAPSKRLAELTESGFRKTQKGIAIAENIGLPVIRSRCPVFDDWVRRLESL